MAELPKDVTASLARSVGAYVRATPNQELPGSLRRFRSFTPRGLAAHASELTTALDKPALRARLLKWMTDNNSLRPKDARILRIACEHADGWERELSQLSATPPTPKRATRRAKSEPSAVERERERTRRAREEARRAKEVARREIDQVKARLARADKEVATLRAELVHSNRATDRERATAARTTEQLERERRRNKALVERLEHQRDVLKNDLKQAQKEIAAARRATAPAPQPAKPAARTAPARPSRARTRRALRVPSGLLEDAPETLARWLRRSDVSLLIDGYNVTKSRGGFGDLSLEGQRERLIQEVGRLARRHDVRATIVFDGSDVPPATTRRNRGAVRVEYSKESETADDHLVARLERMVADPVIVVTSDRELQRRSRALGATVANSRQFLAVIRG